MKSLVGVLVFGLLTPLVSYADTINVPADYPSVYSAISNANEGDLILIAPGTYNENETIYVNKPNITIASKYYTTGDESYIDSTIIIGNPLNNMIDGVKYESPGLKLIGLTLRGGRKGITFKNDGGVSDHNKFFDTMRDAVSFDRGGGVVTYNYIENPGDDAVDVDSNDGDFLIANNEMINPNDDGIEIHLWNRSSTTPMHYEIRDNYISGAGEDGIQLIDSSSNSIRTFEIHRNIFVNITDVSIGSMNDSTVEDFQGTAMSERVLIHNNYFYGSNYHITGGDNTIILNNIFESAYGVAVSRAKGNSITDHNLFFNNSVDMSDTIAGGNNHFGDPLGNADFTLMESSPAIDSGSASYVHSGEVVLTIASRDYQGLAPDVGRYESSFTVSTPLITLVGANPLNLIVGDTFVDPGATAFDDPEGDLSAFITVSEDVNTAVVGSYTVSYSVTDSAGNTGTASRTVVVSDPTIDTVAPVVTLVGANPLNLIVGDTFVDPGATAFDDPEGDLSAFIMVSEDVNTAVVGSYTVSYSVTDSAGNTGTASRTVVVSDLATETFIWNGDDGGLTGWSVYDNNPAGARIANVFDSELGSNVIELTGDGTKNGARLRGERSDGTFENWGNTSATTLDIKVNFAENFKIYVQVETLYGKRLYTYANYPEPAGNDSNYKVWHDISAEYTNGTWQNISRNLKYDIQSAEPGNDLVQIDAIIVKGSGRIDDVILSGSPGIPRITILGDNPLNLIVGDTFVDPGATAFDDPEGDLSAFITVSEDVNTAVVGSYTVSYSVTDSAGNTGTASRTVVVSDPTIDTVAPVVTLVGANPLNLIVGDTFVDPGATAFDDPEGDLSAFITVSEDVNTAVVGSYTVSYSVTDSAGNTGTASRTVVVSDPTIDTVAPVVTLVGANPLNLIVGDTFVDPGATAFDDPEGDLSAFITVSEDVNTAVVGSYTVSYSVTDSAGNTGTASRTVVVSDPTIDTVAPVVTLVGANPLNLIVGDTFVDPGATAFDDPEGDLSAFIMVSEDVNTAVVGSYTVSYSVTDSAGNTGTASRTVVVSDLATETFIWNGDDGGLTGWSVYDNNPAGARIANVFDSELGSNVIELTGDGTKNGARLRGERSDGTFENWGNTSATTLDIKVNFAENFKIYVQVETLYGKRLYTYANYPEPAGNDSNYKVWHDISAEYTNGTWQNISRNLKYDIQSAEPGNDLVQIDAIIVKGSGRIDDVILSGSPGIPRITILGDNPLNLIVGDTFVDPGATAFDDPEGDLSAFITVSEDVNTAVVGSYTVSYSVTDSAGNTGTASRTVVVSDPAEGTVYWNGDDGSITGWVVYDNNPAGASITNVFDSEWGSNVIELSGSGISNGYRLREELISGTYKNWENRVASTFSWSMNFDENFKIYVQVETLYGKRLLTYANFPMPSSTDTSLYLWHDISDEYANGYWQTLSRNLILDLQNAEPGNELISIDSLIVKGSGRLDDIVVSGYRSYPALNRAGFIYRDEATQGGDLERMAYVGSDNSLMITDDILHRVYKLDLQTESVTQVLEDTEFSAFTEGEISECTLDAENNIIGFCDPEAIAYDEINDEIYVFSGNQPGTLSGFKLSRSVPDQDLAITAWKTISSEISAAVVIEGQLYIGRTDEATGKGKLSPYDWDTGVLGTPVFMIGHEIEDLAYSDGIVWVISAESMLYKVNYADMTILQSYDMTYYDILDPRGIVIVGQKLYIGDGDDARADNLKHAIHVFDIPLDIM